MLQAISHSAGLKELAGLENLEQLYLGSTAVTDEEIKVLAGLKNLQYLTLDSTRLTTAGVARLQRALPKLNVIG